MSERCEFLPCPTCEGTGVKDKGADGGKCWDADCTCQDCPDCDGTGKVEA